MSINCVNQGVNLEICVCTNSECERRGICCFCVANHKANGNLPACLRPPSA